MNEEPEEAEEEEDACKGGVESIPLSPYWAIR